MTISLMNNPSNEQLQEQIAKVLGFTKNQNWQGTYIGDTPYMYWESPAGSVVEYLPNWPTDRNASYGLPVEDDYPRFLSAITTYHEINSAYDESLAWLLYKGWRWVECKHCDNGVQTHCRQFIEGKPFYNLSHCPICNGKSGEWAKV